MPGTHSGSAGNVISRAVGNATQENEFTFEYQVKSKEERASLGLDQLEELPFQVQVAFTRLDGMKCLRVISQKRPLTKDRSMAEAAAKLEVLSCHVTQTSATIAQDGDYYGARATTRAYQNMMNRCAHTEEQSETLTRWANDMAELDDELMRTEMAELEDSDDDEAGSMALGMKSSASRKAARSKNDKLSSMLFKSKKANNSKFKSGR